MAKRKDISEPIRRRVLVEAGHRCAIPTCRQPSPLEIHHIVDHAKTQDDSFENLICLCRNCHGRATEGKIDQLSIRAYKANLGLLNARYIDLERRLIQHFVDTPSETAREFQRNMRFEFHDLLRDGVLSEVLPTGQLYPRGGDLIWGYHLTDSGVQLVEDIRKGREVA